MIEVEGFILIGCLLQGALGRQWAVWLPQSIEALNGSCVLIPCRFEIPSEHDKNLVAGAKGLWKKHSARGETVFDSSITETTPDKNKIKGKLIGDLLKKNCTTILDHFPASYSDTYFFRLESQRPLLFNFGSVRINAQDSPSEPKLTPEKVEVTEGALVSLSCSAAAPCPELPPNLTWTPRRGDSVDQLQKNEDQTKSVSSVLTFTASHRHHGQKITCRALYTLQQGDIQKTSEASLTLRVLYMPQISGSGSCSRTAAEISCSCESRGNPSPSMEWRVSGLRVTNSTDRVIREEQLGNTGLRSSLTMRQSQGDTPTVLCISTNSLGSSSLLLHVLFPQQCSGLHTISLLIGAGAMMIICLILQLILKRKIHSQCSESGMKHNEELILTDKMDTQDEESINANKTMLSGMRTVEKGNGSTLHYATVDFSKLPGGAQGTGIIRGTSKGTSDYAVVRHKSREDKGGEGEDEEAPGEVQKEGQTELGPERETTKATGRNEEESCLNLSPQASINPEPSEEATYGNICHSRATERAQQGQQQWSENPAREEEVEEHKEENSTGDQEDMYVDVISPLIVDNGKGTGESEYAEVRELR